MGDPNILVWTSQACVILDTAASSWVWVKLKHDSLGAYPLAFMLILNLTVYFKKKASLCTVTVYQSFTYFDIVDI